MYITKRNFLCIFIVLILNEDCEYKYVIAYLWDEIKVIIKNYDIRKLTKNVYKFDKRTHQIAGSQKKNLTKLIYL